MRKFIMISALILATTIANAQTTATNWTAQDCNNTAHTLFNELDNGKVVIMVWVMPCNSCISGAKAAYDVYQQMEASHPGKVVFYLADDIGDATCTQLNSWLTANSIGDPAKMVIFSNDGNVIDEAKFGGSGMPHVTVMAGTDHKIYYNKKNGAANDPSGIKSAVGYALNVVTSVADVNNLKFSVSPNPVKDQLQINYKGGVEKVVITSVTGQVVKEQLFNSAESNPRINMAGIAPGIYTLKITDKSGQSGVLKVIKE